MGGMKRKAEAERRRDITPASLSSGQCGCGQAMQGSAHGHRTSMEPPLTMVNTLNRLHAPLCLCPFRLRQGSTFLPVPLPLHSLVVPLALSPPHYIMSSPNSSNKSSECAICLLPRLWWTQNSFQKNLICQSLGKFDARNQLKNRTSKKKKTPRGKGACTTFQWFSQNQRPCSFPLATCPPSRSAGLNFSTSESVKCSCLLTTSTFPIKSAYLCPAPGTTTIQQEPQPYPPTHRTWEWCVFMSGHVNHCYLYQKPPITVGFC